MLIYNKYLKNNFLFFLDPSNFFLINIVLLLFFFKLNLEIKFIFSQL